MITPKDEANIALVSLMMSVKHTDPVLYANQMGEWHRMADEYHTKLKEAQ